MALLDMFQQNPDIAKALGINVETARGKAFTQGLLGSIFQAAALSGPQPRPVSTAQALGQVGLAGMGAYESSFDKQLQEALTGLKARSMVSEMTAPKYMTIKTPAGGEALVQIPRGGGAPTPVQIPGLDISKPIDFDAPTQAFISLKFGKPFNELNPEQKLEVSQFMNAPNDEKITSLRIEAEKQQFETGQRVTIPRARSEFLTPSPAVTPPPAPAVAPPAPVITPPAAKPTSAEVTEADISKLRVPLSLVSRTMTEKDSPLIESAGVSPKQKQELLMAKPQTQSSVEYVVNTNRAMRNTIQQILSSPGFNDAFGFGGQTLSKIPGSPAADVLGDLEKLGGSLFVEAITALRNASKTGAGVGNATEKEGDKLERSKASIQQFRSPEAAKAELQKLLKSLEDAEANVLNAYERTYGKGSFRFSPLETPEAKGKRPPLQNIFGVPQ